MKKVTQEYTDQVFTLLTEASRKNLYGKYCNMPIGVIEKMMKVISAALIEAKYKDNPSYLVIDNPEIAIYLTEIGGVAPTDIVFLSDNEAKIKLIKHYGMTDLSGRKDFSVHMKFDIVIAPFVSYKKDDPSWGLCEKYSNRFVFYCIGARFMRNVEEFKKVRYFKNLGTHVIKDRSDLNCIYLVDKDKGDDDGVYIEGDVGKPRLEYVVTHTPGTDIDAWNLIQDVKAMNLLSYDAHNGKLSRTNKSQVNQSETKVAWLPDENDKGIIWDYINDKVRDKLYGLGEHKIFIQMGGEFENIDYLSPEFGIGSQTFSVIMESKEDARVAIEYLNTPQVQKLVKGIKSTLTTNGKSVWSMIPHHSLKDQWFPLCDGLV